MSGARRSPCSVVFGSVARADEGRRSQGDFRRRAARCARSRRDRAAEPARRRGRARRRRRGGLPDAAYTEAGAELSSDAWAGVDAVAKVAPPAGGGGAAERGPAPHLVPAPLTDRERIERLREKGVLAFAMESIPRTTRAQSMDALSSQATVAGYKAVLIGAEHLPRFLPMLTTAAGTIAPARALVLGAGVAGLQAIATARRLGCGRVGLRRAPGSPRAGAVARRDLPRPRRRRRGDRGRLRARADAGGAGSASRRRSSERIPDFDLVITTAAIPGRPAPRLIPAVGRREACAPAR